MRTSGGSRWLITVALLACSCVLCAQENPPAAANTILPLYHALRTVRLDTSKVFKIREAVIDREDLHIFFNDGTVVFTQEVEGKITGLYFEGDGEVLLRPPNRTEKLSLGLFTKEGVLADKFTHAYLRFNDDVYAELKASLRPPVDLDTSQVAQFDDAAVRLADLDALRLLTAFTSGPAKDETGRTVMADRFLHARIGGSTHGTYDLFYDTRNPEQIVAGQLGHNGGFSYYDLWMSFLSRHVREGKTDGVVPLRTADAVHVDKFKIEAVIHPPKDLSGEALLDVSVRQGGPRMLFFELSHELKVKSVVLGGAPIEFLQNEAIEGTQLARRGNDFIAVVLPAPCKPGEKFRLEFRYEGSVLADAGGGLLYVGARGTWYPNRGLTPSQYEMTFSYPPQWTLLATGEKASETQEGELRRSTWVTNRPIPIAGFNLGQYVEARDKAQNAEIEAYASHGVEKDLPSTQTYTLQRRRDPWSGPGLEEITVSLNFNPAAGAKIVAREAAKSVEFYDSLLGPYPYPSLKLTQLPGPDSQGWPGLIYLSSYTFLTPEEREHLGMNDFVKTFFGTLVTRHEVAHMWWGHQVFWNSYRDQWLSEALANYSALLMTQQDEPQKFRIIMDGYRSQLLSKREGADLYEAGPVTLGLRLNSSKFPDAYQAIAYGRGTWLIHMLRSMLQDGTRASRGKTKVSGDDLFIQALRSVLQKHRDGPMTNDDLREAFEQVWPESLRFEGRKSLDWFFDGWVNGTAIPALEVSGLKFAKQGTEEFVSGVIHQKDAPDDLVTSIPVYSQNGERFDYLGRVFAVGNDTRFRLPSHGGHKIVLDPFHTVLTRPN
ncbi:peptidase M1, membrane alanine aminopeptidase [Candidatus Koribacter versatilis Ellin345]|uniref:Peptidase M1, membrane alanine aminopeptidase n=1 Tax=Koribacter versatilis (strain Ellin345) TaxID=204669 RepID=Q1IIM4_KORVE|nr:M1 family aminopeptidase [Candidatus Koribacter versatilis]ABF43276.1 peptidase M1, membrane alanine aminopeptidase [Candidatus Koribacter versatilis Ellin345]